MKFTPFLLSYLFQTRVILAGWKKGTQLKWKSDWFDCVKSQKLQQGGTRKHLKNIIWSSPLHQDRIKYSFKSIPVEYLPTHFEEALMKEAPHPPTYTNPFQYTPSPTVRKSS